MKFALALFGAVTMALASCGPMPGPSRGPAVSESLQTATATIDAVDKEERIIRLHGDETGQRFTVYANDGIKNLDQLTAGDIVVVEYYEATTLSMATPNSPDASIAVATAEAAPGELPGGIAVESETVVVELLDYDRDEGIATYLTPDGLQRRSAVPPRLQTFAQEANRGDMIEVTMTQAVAVSVEEVES
ncbi:hypothetical protein [Amaricoccus macauensis]|uniref:hypothetical protein n=1 Tax=Amaricoccus macauensis TaxID=57001 RepID=UPI003C7A1FB9